MMAKNFDAGKSKVRFEWQPRGDKGVSIKIDTTDKAHNLTRIRSRTKSSLIVVSSASNPFSTESWTFVFNFPVETLIATRVQSNIAASKVKSLPMTVSFTASTRQWVKPVNRSAEPDLCRPVNLRFRQGG
jgi:hypothetical protein